MHQKYKEIVEPKGGSKMSFQVKTDIYSDCKRRFSNTSKLEEKEANVEAV